MTTTFFTPAYIDIVHKTGDRWITLGTSAIYNMSGRSYAPAQKYSKFGLTQISILKELYKRYQGLDGWYVVHMAKKDYYYCGATAEDVQSKLVELGVKHR